MPKISDEQILSELQAFYIQHSRPPRSTENPCSVTRTIITRRFGSWNNALLAAGLPTLDEIRRGSNVPKYTKDDLIRILRDFANENGRTPKMSDFRKGSPSVSTFFAYFGTWNNALEQAGLDVNLPQNIRPEDLISDLQNVAEMLGRSPTYREYDRYGRFTTRTMTRVIGKPYPEILSSIGLKPITRGQLADAVIRMMSKYLNDVPEREKTFEWLRNDRTGALMRLDAYFPKYHFGLEFHGEQHFRPVVEWEGVAGFIEQQYRDQLKMRLCKENGLPLLVLTYKDDLSPKALRELAFEYVKSLGANHALAS